MNLHELLEETRTKYRNEKDPSKRKAIESFGKSLKSYIERVELDKTIHDIEQNILK